MRILSGADVIACLPMPDAIAVARRSLEHLANKSANIPLRINLQVGSHGNTLFKPGCVGASGEFGLGLKVVSVRPDNAQRHQPSVQGAVMLFDHVTGAMTGVLDGTSLTALRTAAASGAATDLLALPHATIVVIFGAGLQASFHIEAMLAVRNICKVFIINRNQSRAVTVINDWRLRAPTVEFCAPSSVEDINCAIASAHIICTCTNSSTPLFAGHLVSPGCLINAIGSYTPHMQEIDASLVARAAHVYADDVDSVVVASGCILVPLTQNLIHSDKISSIGDAFLTEKQLTRRAEDIVIYKSVGNAVMDLCTAEACLQRSVSLSIGVSVAL